MILLLEKGSRKIYNFRALMILLDTKIEELKKVGPTYLKRLHSLGLNKIRDLFFHFPHRYDDFSQIVSISDLCQGKTATIQAEIVSINNIRIWKRKLNITEALIKDKSGSLKVVWFNQPYLTDTLKKGALVNFSGKVTFTKNVLCLSNPVYEISKQETTHTGRLVPIYHETRGLSSRYLRFLIKPFLYLTDNIKEYLPQSIKKEYGLIDLNKAIKQIHFPDNLETAQTARFRLSFNELYLIQLKVLKQRQVLSQSKAYQIDFDKDLIKFFVESLPFKLTDDQRLAAWEIFLDLNKARPMNRLLDGDVGSGKTVVAAMAALACAKTGYQTALMAPTEILAKQHFQTFKQLFKNTKGVKIALLTSSQEKIAKGRMMTRTALKKQVAQGKIDILIGTHSLIQKDISFSKLALAIVDEQHRFGIKQRAALVKDSNLNDNLPHLLSMTATPIPRTLALTIYGDLDISLLKQMPKGRKAVRTKVITPAERNRAYEFIKKQVASKKQVFVICPLIDQSEKLEVKSVTQEFEKLDKEVFPNLKILMLHGKLKSPEKEKIMKDFKEGKADILVSTSVIEVGVDIPNATIMMIEGADRFGLAQLHQFRGRVGRSEDQAYCFLLTDSPTIATRQRLSTIANCNDGFKLAEKDLKIRGPGEISGSRQWGLPDLVMASLSDLKLVQLARQAASQTIEQGLITAELNQKIKSFYKQIHLE